MLIWKKCNKVNIARSGTIQGSALAILHTKLSYKQPESMQLHLEPDKINVRTCICTQMLFTCSGSKLVHVYTPTNVT